MHVEVSAERPVARRDKACALPRLWPPGQGAQRGIGAPQGASRRVGRQRHGAGAARLALAPAKPAPTAAASRSRAPSRPAAGCDRHPRA
ncbi:hypothetical protein XpiCFBP4643_07100 [Xanthomonas pisi]|uniref:Uncharacterized protein n=1 Tax=Xanthomonas pisi TaxID=56457 RepID=A0A2S7D613_9XANT|nr:hypothetical protein XpiCFBP4643_07100 [Xanthomonas pisi]